MKRPRKDQEETKRRDRKLCPENGICLSALYDRAFDKGLITISPDDYTIRLSSALREYETQDYYDRHFGIVNGKKIIGDFYKLLALCFGWRA